MMFWNARWSRDHQASVKLVEAVAVVVQCWVVAVAGATAVAVKRW